MILEYSPSGTLFDTLKTRGRFTRHRALQIAHNVASGIAVLQKLGFWHRDLDSSAVFLQANGDAKIGNFGKVKDRFSRMEYAIASEAERTYVYTSDPSRTSSALDLRWMSPEIVNGGVGAATETSDIYSFGVILWELVSGAQPFQAIRDDQLPSVLWKAHNHTSFLVENTLPQFADCSSRLVALIDQCTSKFSGARPAPDQILELFSELQASSHPETASLPSNEEWKKMYDVAVSIAPLNPSSALLLYESVIRYGDLFHSSRAATNAALLLLETDFRRALQLLETASLGGHSRAQQALVHYLITGSPNQSVPPNLEAARQWFRLLEQSHDPVIVNKIENFRQLLL